MNTIKRIIPLILLICTHTVEAQDSLALQKFIKQGGSDELSVYVGINFRQLSIGNQLRELPLYQLRLDFFRFFIDVNGNELSSTNKLYYSINRGNYNATDYKYKLLILNAKFGGLLKTFRIKHQLVSLGVGYSISNYTVRDINPNFLVNLVAPTDFVQVERMAGTLLHEALVSAETQFWFKNQEFVLRLTGFVPIKSQTATLSRYQSGGNSLLFTPTFKNLFDFTLSYGITPKFRVNPLKLKTL